MEFLFFLTLAGTIILVVGKRAEQAILMLAIQGLLLAIISAILAYQVGNSHLYMGAVLTLVFKALIVPVALYYIIGKIKVRRKVDLVFSPAILLLLSVGLVLLSNWITSPQFLPADLADKDGLSVALALLLMGLLMMITRKKAINQLLGLLVMENSLYLATIVATQGMGLMVEIGMFFDLLIAVLIIGIFLFHIDKTFDSIDTDKLTRLKG